MSAGYGLSEVALFIKEYPAENHRGKKGKKAMAGTRQTLRARLQGG